MSALWQIFRLVLDGQRQALLRGALLGLAVLLMGVGLLGLSGWFITAAAAAGLAGLGAVFDVFRPSALVRLLALGRAAARYGERLLTHDATLRLLETLRLRLLAAQLAAPWGRLTRLRGAQALNRLTADVDALDGVPLRLVLPLASGLCAQGVVFAALWGLVGLPVALWVLGVSLAGAAAVFLGAARRAVPLSRRAEQAAQAFRSRLVDLIRARPDLATHGRLAAQAAQVLVADQRRQADRRALDRIERRAGAAISGLASLIVAGALGLGLSAAAAGRLDPAFAALGVFAALALTETLHPLRRALADLGRMSEAARRVRRDLQPQAASQPPAPPPGAGLQVSGLTLLRPGTHLPVLQGFGLQVAPGETVALTGASGSGKSTLLLAIAGVLPVAAGEICVLGSPVQIWPEPALRQAVTLVPQRHALMAGTVAEALRLAAPEASDAVLLAALEAVCLTPVIAGRGGLQLRLGPQGEGLSGGEGRRLALARALLRQPRLLLLDEPTEGLDEATAAQVLQGMRRALPQAAILMASHRAAETAFADRVVALHQRHYSG